MKSLGIITAGSEEEVEDNDKRHRSCLNLRTANEPQRSLFDSCIRLRKDGKSMEPLLYSGLDATP